MRIAWALVILAIFACAIIGERLDVVNAAKSKAARREP